MTKQEFYELYKEIKSLRTELKTSIKELYDNRSWDSYYKLEKVYGLYTHIFNKYYEELMRRYFKTRDDNPQIVDLLKQIKEIREYEEEVKL